jgi:toxin ParE1/3/4
VEVIFSQFAREDLRSIREYIYDNNQATAKKVVAHIVNKIQTLLVVTPSMGRAGRVLRTRELVITKYPYIVSYRVKENEIQILRVLHTSRKWGLD